MRGRVVLWGAIAAAQTAAAVEQGSLEALCGECRVERFAECGGFLEGATVAPDGTLWVVDLLSGNVLSIDGRGTCTVRANTGGQPNGAKFHRDGRLFVADKLHGIVAIDPRSGDVTRIVDMHRTERLRGTNDLVFDDAGGLYFTEPYGSGVLEPNGRVFYLPADGSGLRVLEDSMAFPNGIVLTPDGSAVLVGEYARKRIISVPSLGASDPFATTYVWSRTDGGIGPDGIAFDERGNLYAAIFQGGAVQVFDAAGYEIGRISLPEGAGTFVTNLAFGGEWLYITEASQGVVWRVRMLVRGLPLFHQR